MTAMRYLTFLIVVCIPGIVGQITRDGPCPKIPAVCNFRLNLAAGKWFLQQTYIQNTDVFACPSELYTLNSDSTLSVNATNFVISQNEFITTFRGVIIPDSCKSGRLVFVSADAPPMVLRLRVVGVQYKKYVFTYGCVDLPGNQRQELLFILTRDQLGLDNEVKRRVEQLHKKYGIDTAALLTYDQSAQTCG